MASNELILAIVCIVLLCLIILCLIFYIILLHRSRKTESPVQYNLSTSTKKSSLDSMERSEDLDSEESDALVELRRNRDGIPTQDLIYNSLVEGRLADERLYESYRATRDLDHEKLNLSEPRSVFSSLNTRVLSLGNILSPSTSSLEFPTLPDRHRTRTEFKPIQNIWLSRHLLNEEEMVPIYQNSQQRHTPNFRTSLRINLSGGRGRTLF